MKTLFALIPIACCLTLAGCKSSSGGGTASVSSVEDTYEPVSYTQTKKTNYREEGPDGANPEQDFHRTSSGLRYRILRRGNGTRPSEYDRVKVSYRGWLNDGTEFDSSYKRGKPTMFKLKQVVAGWTEGMQYVSEGGKIELEIPSDLGYGLKGQPPTIPPASTLHFIVELHEVY